MYMLHFEFTIFGKYVRFIFPQWVFILEKTLKGASAGIYNSITSIHRFIYDMPILTIVAKSKYNFHVDESAITLQPL